MVQPVRTHQPAHDVPPAPQRQPEPRAADAGQVPTRALDSVRAAPVRNALFAPLPARLDVEARASSSQVERASQGKRPLESPSSAVLGDTAAKRPRTGEGSANRRWSAVPAQAPAADAAHVATAKGGRQNVTAEMVHTILLARSQGLSALMISRVHSIPRITVFKWVDAKYWSTNNSAARLAKIPDYKTHREALDKLAKRLALTTEDLPPPAKSRVPMDAFKLKAALELLIEKQAIRGAGPGKGPNVLLKVGEEVGCSSIPHWLKVDGELRKPPAAIVRLKGYAELREDLQTLLVRLGHAQTAAKLSQSVQGTVAKVTAGLLVEAITMMSKDPALSLNDVSAALGLGAELLPKYIERGSGRLCDQAAVRKLSDYGLKREALEAALTALGHGEQAGALPLAQIDGAAFLKTLRIDFNRIAAAIRAMKDDPSLTPHAAAAQAKMSPVALAACVGSGGTVRERAAVHEALTGFKPHLAAGIDEQLDQLRAVSLGNALPAKAVPVMQAMRFPERGHIPARVFVVRETSGDPGPRAKNRLEGLYADNPDLVRAPRNYEWDRPRQALRWLSTVLMAAFPEGREIQCYYDSKRKEIVVSSNLPAANKVLAATLPRGGLIDIIERLCERGVAQGSREARHLEKLLVTLHADASKVGPVQLGEVLAAMSKGKFRVPLKNFNEGGRQVNLHAERRIKADLQRTVVEEVNPRLLAGTKRPCGTCADDLGLPDTARRGPFWESQSAQAFVDAPRIIERNVAEGIGTYVTKTRDGKVTADYDTDSDSDIEDTEARMAQSRG